MTVTITPERADSPDAILLIDELEATLAPLYPDESRHGYSVEKLLRTGVHFFVLRNTGALAGCGGVQFFGTDYAELKRMYVRPDYRGMGYGRMMLEHLAAYSFQSGITVLRLETGIHQKAAVRLYEAAGFTRVPPFGEYQEDPNSIFFEKRLPANYGGDPSLDTD